MFVLKHLPEDFIVKEVSTVQPKAQGKFVYFLLKKRDFTIHEALRRLAQKLNLSPNNFSYAGIKDRRAISEQMCSSSGVTKQQLERVNLQDVNLSFIGYGNEPVHLGDLEGNKFEIVIRSIDKLPKVSAKFKNLFGEQRFSTQNVEVGRFLLHRKFKEAAEVIAAKDNQLSKLMQLGSSKDYVGALRRIPRKQLLFFIHAFQSHLWNKAAMKTKEKELPLVGFGTVVEDNATKEALAEENIKPRDFIIKELPEISAEGGTRTVWSQAKDLKIGKLEPDECFKGKKKVKLDFFLPKGCYATEFVGQNF